MNYNSVIQKCVEELGKDSPRLDYVRGMLETLLSLNTIEITPTTTPPVPLAVVQTPTSPETLDEATMMDAQVRAALKNMPSLTLE